MNRSKNSLNFLVLSAMLAALCCVTTMLIHIPSPTGGYINLGDCVVLLSGWMLGPVWGFAAAGVGSALSDLISGYAHYVPGTFLIKGVVATVGVLLFKVLRKRIKSVVGVCILSGFAGELIMIVGYFLYSSLFMGKGAAAIVSVPGNCLQAVVGIAISTLLYASLTKNRYVGKYFYLYKS